jgi:hypothetical protein
MKKFKPYYRPVNPEIAQELWGMGLDTYEIALRTGFKESEVHRHLSTLLNRRWLERYRDKNNLGPPTQC